MTVTLYKSKEGLADLDNLSIYPFSLDIIINAD
jgi:hypothetical protein